MKIFSLIPSYLLNQLISQKAEWKGTPDKSNFKYFSKCNLKSQFEMTSLLIVYDVDRNDVGLYKCIVNNGIGGDVTKTIELIKECKLVLRLFLLFDLKFHFSVTPQIIALPKFSKAAGNHGNSVSLYCYIRAEPKPKVTWFFGRYNSTISANSKYRINITRYRPGFYVAQLIIVSLQRTDHGNYICKVRKLFLFIVNVDFYNCIGREFKRFRFSPNRSFGNKFSRHSTGTSSD